MPLREAHGELAPPGRRVANTTPETEALAA